jgi:hypothetical protein
MKVFSNGGERILKSARASVKQTLYQTEVKPGQLTNQDFLNFKETAYMQILRAEQRLICFRVFH